MAERFRARKRDRATREELWLALQQAQSEYKRALAEFDAAVAHPPADTPAPDTSLRVEQAGRNQHLAFQSYARALKEFSDFLLGTRNGSPD